MTRIRLMWLSAALASSALLSTTALAAAPVAASGLPDGAPQQGWARYAVALPPGVQAPCCHSIIRGKPVVRGCDLVDDNGFSISDDDPPQASGDGLLVYLHLRDGRIDRVRAFGADCPVRHEGTISELAGIGNEASVSMLAAVVDGDTRSDRARAEQAIAAVAFHAGDAATQRLVDWAERDGDEQRRMPALFWLGQTRGDAGADVLARVASGDAPEAIRTHAVFALAQSDSADAYPTIVSIARRDRDRDVRGQAAFWMAQTGDSRAADDLKALLDDPDEEVSRQVVFALSQLEEGGDAALIEILRGDHPRETKKQAMFWLGQSDSAQAIELFDEVLGSR